MDVTRPVVLLENPANTEKKLIVPFWIVAGRNVRTT
jgi:hypothetical protein